jgi:hypothetical protein
MTAFVPDADVYRSTTRQAAVATWCDQRLRESSGGPPGAERHGFNGYPRGEISRWD